MYEYVVTHIKHSGKENKNFALCRPHGLDEYLFLHFKSPVSFILCGKEYEIESGTCIILSPRTPHGFKANGCELNHDWMHFIPKNEAEFLAMSIKTNTFFRTVDTGFITAAIKKCEVELVYKNEFYEDVVSAEITSMFIRLRRLVSSEHCGYYTESFKKIRLELYRHPKRYPEVDDMASEVGLSHSRFSVLYKQCFGISPKKDLIASRVSKASYLLSNDNLPLEEVADACGYNNIYHFIRQFRNETGVPPGQYRKNIDRYI